MSYRSSLGQRANAALALSLLDAGAIASRQFEVEGTVSEFLERELDARFSEALANAGLAEPTLNISLSLLLCWHEHGQGRLCGGIIVESGQYLDTRTLVTRLEHYSSDAGAGVLSAIASSMWLMPAFTPNVAQDFVEAYHWFGDPAAGELYEMAADELAHERGVLEAELSDEAIRTYAQERFWTWTPERVEQILPARYREARPVDMVAKVR